MTGDGRGRVPRYVAYSDETNWNHGRYRAVAVVSMSVATSRELGPRIRDALGRAFSEGKWAKLKSHDRVVGASEAFDCLLRMAAAGTVRVDVLSWDVDDSRHAVPGRCDLSNLGRMHYWAYQKAMLRWPPGEWFLHPDRHTGTDWDTISKTVEAATRREARSPALWLTNDHYAVIELRERASNESPLTQAADLLAGMSAYSRQTYAKGRKLREERTGQFTLFDINESVAVSGSDRARWRLIEGFATRCRELQLGVSLDSHHGLRTMDPAHPVNFWWWTPQGPHDQAPTRLAAPEQSSPVAHGKLR